MVAELNDSGEMGRLRLRIDNLPWPDGQPRGRVLHFPFLLPLHLIVCISWWVWMKQLLLSSKSLMEEPGLCILADMIPVFWVGGGGGKRSWHLPSAKPVFNPQQSNGMEMKKKMCRNQEHNATMSKQLSGFLKSKFHETNLIAFFNRIKKKNLLPH